MHVDSRTGSRSENALAGRQCTLDERPKALDEREGGEGEDDRISPCMKSLETSDPKGEPRAPRIFKFRPSRVFLFSFLFFFVFELRSGYCSCISV